jgi:hypothetical protein
MERIEASGYKQGMPSMLLALARNASGYGGMTSTADEESGKQKELVNK